MRHAAFKIKNGGCVMVIFLALALFFRVQDVSAAVGGGASGRWTPSAHRTVPNVSKPWSSFSSSFSSSSRSNGVPSPRTRSSTDDNDTTQSTIPIDTRGGQSIGRPSGNLEKTVESIVEIITGVCGTVLPPVIACARVTIRFYRSLPVDFIIAQVGLVYCFAGGYYPTLFAALTAAQQCGWQTMLCALEDLIEEATIAIEAASREVSNKAQSYRDAVTRKTMVVLAAIDPVKINMATGALYTTWLGVSSVLEREFAKTITLSMTLSSYMQPIARFILNPPIYWCVPEEYHQWAPILVGWACKAAAMSVAWRIQRVLAASTSAIAGGLMFARAMMRILSKRGVHIFGIIREKERETPIDEFFGLIVAGLGLYSQIGHGFDFKVPFPLCLVTWPFDWLERWIQWQITK